VGTRGAGDGVSRHREPGMEMHGPVAMLRRPCGHPWRWRALAILLSGPWTR
jgi:hypothetical protein